MDKTQVAVRIFDKLAKEYQNKFMDVSLYADTFDHFCSSIKNDAAILELACGPGNITRYLLEKRSDFKIYGIDLSANMIALAKINNPQASFSEMDCREISSIKNSYDAIMCGFCLPYLSKEEAIKLIADAAELMKEEGMIYLSTMEDDYSRSGLKKGSTGEEMYMHYHEASYLVKALEKNSFAIIDLQRKITSAGDAEPTTDLIIIARKK